jgi:hypothetical protein
MIFMPYHGTYPNSGNSPLTTIQSAISGKFQEVIKTLCEWITVDHIDPASGTNLECNLRVKMYTCVSSSFRVWSGGQRASDDPDLSFVWALKITDRRKRLLVVSSSDEPRKVSLYRDGDNETDMRNNLGHRRRTYWLYDLFRVRSELQNLWSIPLTQDRKSLWGHPGTIDRVFQAISRRWALDEVPSTFFFSLTALDGILYWPPLRSHFYGMFSGWSLAYFCSHSIW